MRYLASSPVSAFASVTSSGDRLAGVGSTPLAVTFGDRGSVRRAAGSEVEAWSYAIWFEADARTG